MIKSGNSEIVSLRGSHISLEALNVDPVASAAQQTAATRVIRQRHVGVPHLFHQGVDSDVAGIQGIQVLRSAGAIDKDSVAHIRGRNRPLDGHRVRPAEALVIGKKVGFSAKYLFRNKGTASGGAGAG